MLRSAMSNIIKRIYKIVVWSTSQICSCRPHLFTIIQNTKLGGFKLTWFLCFLTFLSLTGPLEHCTGHAWGRLIFAHPCNNIFYILKWSIIPPSQISFLAIFLGGFIPYISSIVFFPLFCFCERFKNKVLVLSCPSGFQLPR